jgi:hypothetical protein
MDFIAVFVENTWVLILIFLEGMLVISCIMFGYSLKAYKIKKQYRERLEEISEKYEGAVLRVLNSHLNYYEQLEQEMDMDMTEFKQIVQENIATVRGIRNGDNN